MPSWKMRNGERIELSDMRDRHLLNTIRMLERNAKARLDADYAAIGSIGCFVQGEHAQLDIDCIERAICNSNFTDYVPPIYWDMLKEAKMRGIWQGE